MHRRFAKSTRSKINFNVFVQLSHELHRTFILGGAQNVEKILKLYEYIDLQITPGIMLSI